MMRFKSILSQALAKQALRIRFIANKQPEWLVGGGTSKDSNAQNVEHDGMGPFSESDLQEVIAAILPGQTFESSGMMTGSLNVGANRILKLCARKSNGIVSLDVYSPQGESLYNQDMNPTTPVASTPSVLPPPPPMSQETVAVARDHPAPAKVENTSAPALEAPLESDQIFKVSSAPKKVKVPSLSGTSEQVVVPDIANSTLPQPLPAPSLIAQQAPSPFAMTPNTPPTSAESPFAIGGTAPLPKAELPLSPPPIAKITEAQQAPAPTSPVSPLAHDNNQNVEIDFGSKEASEGSVSRGQNPIDKLLQEMVKMKASDMHLTIGQPVIYRISGDITRVSQEEITSQYMQALMLPTMPERNRAEFAKIHDTDFAYELVGVGRFRVNMFRDRNGVGAVLRHIPSQILTAEQLNLSPAIMKLCTLNKGLVVVTGPTGSGKSTTLAAMIDHINKTRKEHILTIEDPIEFVHQQQKCLVNQREVHKHTGSFARALKAALREDPDIVLIGEMRDLETIAIAIETAETGHLVFGTLHTTTAMSTVDRVIDQFPADRQAQIRTMLAGSLRGVVAQTLLKKKSGGRVAAHEILITNDAVSAMIREGKIQHLANHMMTQKADGNQLLNEGLLKLVQDGIVDIQDAFFKSVDKNSFIAMAKSRGLNVDVSPPATAKSA